MRLPNFLMATLVFFIFIFVCAFVLGSSAAASAFIAATFSMLVAPALLIASFVRWSVPISMFPVPVWIAALLYLPALYGDFSYTAGVDRIYENGVPDAFFAFKVVLSVSLCSAAACLIANAFFPKDA